MARTVEDCRGRRAQGLSASILLALCFLSACANVQPSVAQFGTAVTTAQTAENSYLAAAQKRQDDYNSLHLLNAQKLESAPTGAFVQGDPPVDPPVLSPDAAKAIQGIVSTLQAYGQAMLNLSNSTAAATLTTNVNNLGKNASSINLKPLIGVANLTPTQVGALETAVSAIGSALINAIQSRDIQAAARAAQPHLQTIVNGLKQINDVLVQGMTNASTGTTIEFVGAWNAHMYPTFSDKQQAKVFADSARTPVTPTAADNALDAVLKANAAVAAAGPEASKAEIESAFQIVNDAVATYQAFLHK
jgi:hypothetical protein